MKLETIAVHGGYSPDPTTKAVAVPIIKRVRMRLMIAHMARICLI